MFQSIWLPTFNWNPRIWMPIQCFNWIFDTIFQQQVRVDLIADASEEPFSPELSVLPSEPSHSSKYGSFLFDKSSNIILILFSFLISESLKTGNL